MKAKLRATLILQREYEADSSDYGDCESVEDMIDNDYRIYKDDPWTVIDIMFEGGEHKLIIKEIKEV
jgi:hypothetical protein